MKEQARFGFWALSLTRANDEALDQMGFQPSAAVERLVLSIVSGTRAHYLWLSSTWCCQLDHLSAATNYSQPCLQPVNHYASNMQSPVGCWGEATKGHLPKVQIQTHCPTWLNKSFVNSQRMIYHRRFTITSEGLRQWDKKCNRKKSPLSVPDSGDFTWTSGSLVHVKGLHQGNINLEVCRRALECLYGLSVLERHWNTG